MVIDIDDWYGLHKPYSFAVHPGYLPIVGPNGSGKTTLLKQLWEFAKKEDIPVWRYSNLAEGSNAALQKYLNAGDEKMLSTAAFSSEGEGVALNFSHMVPELGKVITKAMNSRRELFVLLDGLDSGASIDRVKELRGLFGLIEKDISHGAPVYLFVAVNNYELAVAPTMCLNPRTGERRTFSSYEQYAEFICTYESVYKRPKRKDNEKNHR